MATLQVRSMDDELYKALGRRAALDNRSISQEVITIIENHLSEPFHKAIRMDDEALKLAGSWDDSHSAEDISKSIRESRVTDRFSEEF